MRALPAALLAALALSGCSGGGPQTYRLPDRPVRDHERSLPYREVADGQVAFAALGISTGLTTITGSHADLPSERGAFVRVRMVTENRYATFHKIDLDRQLLVATDGRTFAPDVNAMRVKRQPTEIELGSRNRIEYDLMYDVPKDARPKALRLYSAPTDGLGVELPHDPGVELPLG
ncbi:DUF4352 domain-containing protein [Actinomadura chokoriensis]|uniref:DUF4352 domain-containing protein n=1 Tax=Actinomadura chokoriensis TaxID=454156 RepID=A0ABV4QXE8_9ACTN